MHLKKNGKLEEFVDAKILGEDARAKWLLMDNAEIELEGIETKRKKEERRRRKDKILNQSLEANDYSLSSDECVRKGICASQDPMKLSHSIQASDEKKFIIHSSINSRKTKLKSNKGVFDVSFH